MSAVTNNPSGPKPRRIALALQGGGAIGAFQAGILEVLHEADVPIDACCASSIGAINAALFFGNERANRLDRLRAFWNGVSIPGSALPAKWFEQLRPPGARPATLRRSLAEADQAYALAFGLPGFFARRAWVPWFDGAGDPAAASLCDTTPLGRTLQALCDFEALNGGRAAVSVVATDVASGRARYFESAAGSLSVAAIMASGALPPWFPAVEVEGQWYWDGSLATGAPMEHIVKTAPMDAETVILRADLWSTDGPVPDNLTDVDIRRKNIEQASRAASFDEAFSEAQALKSMLARALALLGSERVAGDAQLSRAAQAARPAPVRVVPIDYERSQRGTHFKDVQFGVAAIEEHWRNGREAAQAALRKIN